jgi:hypothetical protein
MTAVAAQDAVYLKYNQCLDNDGFQQLAARALALLRVHPAWRLIIDLRFNYGGTAVRSRRWLAGSRQIRPSTGLAGSSA